MASTSLCTDRLTRSSLLQDARNGDRESLGRLFLPYSGGMYLSALRITGNPADAEDVRQEALLKAMSRLDQFAGAKEASHDDLHAWVSRIASNAAIDAIRKRRDGRVFSLDEPSGTNDETLSANIAARTDNPEQRFARQEMRGLMADAIAQLSPDLRRACLLRDVLQYSTQEVAEHLGISAMAVRLRLFRAHRRLREKLSHASQSRKEQSAYARNPRQIPMRVESRRRETPIPFGAFAGYACGD